MTFNLVALRLYILSFSELSDLMDICIDGFTTSSIYTGVSPTTATATTASTNLKTCITNWGTPGNRGSHVDYENLLAARTECRTILNQWAAWAENLTPNDRTSLATIGWPLRDPNSTVGKLEAVENLRQFISRKVNRGTLKLKWAKPLGTKRGQVKSYYLLRGTTSDINQAEVIAVTTVTSYTDETPGTGTKYYFIIPVNSFGDGVPAMVAAAATPIL